MSAFGTIKVVVLIVEKFVAALRKSVQLIFVPKMFISQNSALEIYIIIFVKHEVHLYDVTFSMFIGKLPR